MLDLSAVDWRSLTHAYGPADDVPATLKALAEGKESAEEAAGEFWGNICHQGTVYEATAYAVPFLLEALQNPRVTDKEWLLMLLSDLAAGSSHGAAHGERWVREAHDAVRSGVRIYLSLLESRRSKVRTAAARVLSCFPESAQEIFLQVRPQLYQENNPDVRASLILCYGALFDPGPAMRHVWEEALSLPPSSPQRLAAAIGLIQRDKDRAGQKPVAILLDTLADPESFPEAFVFSVWDIDADPGDTLYNVLGLLGRERATAAFIELLGRMEDLWGPLVDSLLDMAFEEYQGKPITPKMLTPLQRSALTALVAADAAWDRNQHWNASSIGTREGQYQLPMQRAEVETLLREGTE